MHSPASASFLPLRSSFALTDYAIYRSLPQCGKMSEAGEVCLVSGLILGGTIKYIYEQHSPMSAFSVNEGEIFVLDPTPLSLLHLFYFPDSLELR